MHISCCRLELKYVRWYWKPLWILGGVLTIIDEIGRIEVWRWLRKFKDWDHFELHLEKILEVLKKNKEIIKSFPKWNPKEIHEYKMDTIEKEKYATEFASERAEGKAEGKVEGKADLLIKLLEVKFGSLPESYIEKIKVADSDILSQWGINLMHAQLLEAVFKD